MFVKPSCEDWWAARCESSVGKCIIALDSNRTTVACIRMLEAIEDKVVESTGKNISRSDRVVVFLECTDCVTKVCEAKCTTLTSDLCAECVTHCMQTFWRTQILPN